MNRQEPYPGQRCWQNGGLCQIVTLATNFETKEKLVIYQALYGSYEIYACPLSLFLDEMDLSETSNTAKRRLEKDSTGSDSPRSVPQVPEPVLDTTELSDGEIHPKLMEFLDADSEADRYKIVSQMADCIDDRMIDTMAVVLDIVIDDGPLDRRYQELKTCIRTRMRYETNRLR